MHLRLPCWDVVLGGSWGTTLAIAYAQTFPRTVRSIILRGIFLLRSQEVDWLFSSTGGAAKLYPEPFQAFCEAVNVSVDEANSNPLRPLHEYYQRLWAATNESERSNAARSWMQWEFFNSVSHKIPPNANLSDVNATMDAIRSWKPPHLSTVAVYDPITRQWTYRSEQGVILSADQLQSNMQTDDAFIQARFRRDISAGYSNEAPPRDTVSVTPTTPFYLGNEEKIGGETSSSMPVQAMLTCFYSTNNDWCRNYVQLLDPVRMNNLRNIPCIAIQGGMDNICPPDSALDLLNAWSSIELRIPVYAGHSMYDPLITNELIQATDRMADFLRRTNHPA